MLDLYLTQLVPTGARLHRVPTYILKQIVAFSTRIAKTEG
jgi:hypothetical protein